MSNRSIWTDYEVKVHEITQVGSDWLWYWELWVEGEYVNGGLGTSEMDARSRARSYSYQHASRLRKATW